MSRNRIAHFANHFAHSQSSAWEGDQPLGPVLSQQAVVLVPCAVHVVAWQAQLYRLAYEQALVQLAPPSYMTRFFSVWN